MNIKKIEKQLKKINQLFDTIKEDGTVSPIERDLMLSYIRGLYEKIVIPQNNSKPSEEEPKTVPPKVTIKEEPAKVEVPVAPPVDNIAEVVLQEVAEADQSISMADNSTSQPGAVTATSFENKHTVEEVVVEQPKRQVSQELLDLFEFDSVNELSDRLSRAPISDLTKSMGINEKIFTVQELFGGDSALFASAMESMDKFSSIDQARDYLIDNVAVDQEWASEGKIKKAANFIKLISRRY